MLQHYMYMYVHVHGARSPDVLMYGSVLFVGRRVGDVTIEFGLYYDGNHDYRLYGYKDTD